MKTVASLVAAALISMTLSAPAHADPDDDDPGFSVNGKTPGVESWPPVCSDVPLACGLHFHPGPNTWVRPDPEPLH